jgi:hypothetical protein
MIREQLCIVHLRRSPLVQRVEITSVVRHWARSARQLEPEGGVLVALILRPPMREGPGLVPLWAGYPPAEIQRGAWRFAIL